MIDRIMQAFADRWAAVRDETLTADVVYVLAFSLIMLVRCTIPRLRPSGR